MKYFDNSRLEPFRNCPRHFYLRHVRHWCPIRPAISLANGSSWHNAMDIIWAGLTTGYPANKIIAAATDSWSMTMQKEGFFVKDPLYATTDFRTEGLIKELLTGYVRKNQRTIERMEILPNGIEAPFAVPLIPEEKVFYVGRMDKIVRYEKRTLIIEHKTTSAYKKEGFFRSDFVNSFSPNSQIEGMLFAGHLLYPDLKGIWVDAALMHKTVYNGFDFIPVSRGLTALDEWHYQTIRNVRLIQTELEMLEEYRKNRTEPFLPAFPKNTTQCQKWMGYGPCVFSEFCRFTNNPEETECPEGFQVHRWEPFNELRLDKIQLEGESNG